MTGSCNIELLRHMRVHVSVLHAPPPSRLATSHATAASPRHSMIRVKGQFERMFRRLEYAIRIGSKADLNECFGISRTRDDLGENLLSNEIKIIIDLILF